jgi:hypothetical protein
MPKNRLGSRRARGTQVLGKIRDWSVLLRKLCRQDGKDKIIGIK